MKKVYIETSDTLLDRMFVSEGWSITMSPSQADLICFSGGSDVSPMLYEMVKAEYTHNDLKRDEDCCNLFHKFVGRIPMVGICRGGQFLNVMCGGELYQDVDGHNRGEHEATNPETGDVFKVTSAHHQMMIPSEDGEVLLIADESTYQHPLTMYINELPSFDTEAVYYEKDMALCFQPHPEYVKNGEECCVLFFNLIKENFGLEA